MPWAGINKVQVFSGEVASLSRQGNNLSCKCKFGSGIFETQMPVLVKGTLCPHLRGSPGDGTHLISQGCTGPDAVMKSSNWKFTASVANPINAAFPFLLKVSGLAGSGAAAIAALASGRVFVNWFSYGWIEWGVGNKIQRRQIVTSTVPGAGIIEVNLHRYFSSVPVFGDAVVLYPGCDGQVSTCKAYDVGTNPTGKYGNYPNFGADPFTPTGNPSVTGLPVFNVRGGKK